MNNEITYLLLHKKHKDKTRVLASPLRNFIIKMSIDLALSRNRSTKKIISHLTTKNAFNFPPCRSVYVILYSPFV